jgi:hypothetical protein
MLHYKVEPRCLGWNRCAYHAELPAVLPHMNYVRRNIHNPHNYRIGGLSCRVVNHEKLSARIPPPATARGAQIAIFAYPKHRVIWLQQKVKCAVHAHALHLPQTDEDSIGRATMMTLVCVYGCRQHAQGDDDRSDHEPPLLARPSVCARDKHLTRIRSATATGSERQSKWRCLGHGKCDHTAGSRSLHRLVRRFADCGRDNQKSS